MSAALDEAIRRAGSQRSFAALLGITQQSVSKWVLRRRPIPAEYVLLAESHTRVSRHELRPDIYPVDDLPPAPPTLPASGNQPAAPSPALPPAGDGPVSEASGTGPAAPPSGARPEPDGGPVSGAADLAA